MSGLWQFFLGLRQRAGVSIGILLVAVVAAAAGTLGPAYDAAARTSILQDGLHDQVPIARAIEATTGGSVIQLASGLATAEAQVLDPHLGGRATASRLFLPPVEAVLGQVPPPKVAEPTGTQVHDVPLASRTGICAHLRLTAGTCPAARDQVLVSAAYATAAHVATGGTIDTGRTGYGTLHVTGEYALPSAAELANDPYWLGAQCDDFSGPCASGANDVNGPSVKTFDALFTPVATFDQAPDTIQGAATVVLALNPDGVRSGDLGNLSAAVGELTNDQTLSSDNISVTSSIPVLTAQVTSDWGSLDVPVLVISLQLLLLAWLLLFLIATDAAEARAPEVALAKLRGYGGVRTVAFGISEPAILLLISFPAGALTGWGLTAGLARVLLRPGTPADLTPLAIGAAALSTLGGLAAVLIAARNTLRRPVTAQWQRTARDATKRGWVLDGILLTGAVAGLAELLAGGNVSSARSGSLGLLVPGLLGLAVAVVASRLLPAACAALFRRTRRHGGTGLFLAVRHIARRPGGTRTTIVLTASFALATFAIAAYFVQQGNIARVAQAQNGAAGVMVVTAPPGQDLATIVGRADPSGTQATVVDRYTGTSDGSQLLAVNPAQWARIAQWAPGFYDGSTAGLAKQLEPFPPSTVVLPARATAVRLTAAGIRNAPPGATATLWMIERGSTSGGQTSVSLGPLRDGTLAAQLSDCPCDITMLSLDSDDVLAKTYSGSVTLSALATQAGSGPWTPVTPGLSRVTGWGAGSEFSEGCQSAGSVSAPDSALAWSWTWGGACSPALNRRDLPSPVPALAATGLTQSTGSTYDTLGLDGQNLATQPIALAAAVPGSPSSGIVVSRAYAQLAADYISSGFAQEEVWTAPGALASVRSKLEAAGVQVASTTTTADIESVLSRQGPALASVLFLAAAAAAALLAGGAAVLALYQAGRRRRLEYAALLAGRVPRRALRASVLIEQAVVLGFGIIAGVVAGIVAAIIVLRNVPEFATPPASPPLVYNPPAVSVAVPLVVVIAVLAAAAIFAALAVIRAARPELLRQGQA
ncbi:MAG TPA: FtsX-like permease family protein [Trebonia sp.]|nr:FtsX-like permease family protein [Trebonia sp.]